MRMNTKALGSGKWVWGAKVVVVVLWLAAGMQSVQAQLEWKRYAESRKSSVALVGNGHLVGWNEGQSCWMGEARGGKTLLVWIDSNMIATRQVVVPVVEDSRCLSAALTKGEVRMLFVSEPDRKHTVVYGVVVASEKDTNGKADTTLVVDTFAYSRKDKCMVWGASSPNGRYQALVSVVELKETREYQARVRLLNEAMQTVWVKEYGMGSLEQVAVTDCGEVVTLSLERVEGENHVVYNIASERRSDSYDVVIEGRPITDLRLAGVVGRHVMAMGVFAPDGKKVDDKQCEGVVGLSFHIDDISVASEFRTFQYDDLCVLFNLKGGRKISQTTVPYGSLVDVALMPWGAVAAVGSNYMQAKVENNGTETPIYYRMGICLVAVDTLGEVRWVSNLRRNDMQKATDRLLRVAMVPRGESLWLVKSEHRKLVSPQDRVKPAKKMKMGDKSNLALYVIGNDGVAERSVLEMKTKHSLLHAVAMPNGGVAIFTANGKRLRMATVVKQEQQ